MKVDAVIFDIDGTVLNTERIYMDSWRLAAKEAGFPMPDEALAKTRSIDPSEAEKIFQHYCGQDFNYPEIWKRRVEISEEIIASRNPEDLIKPGVPEFFRFLEERGIKKAVASMTLAKRTYPHLESAGLLERFDVIVTGDDVKNGKPAPDIFLLAAEKLGVDPACCVVCEDSGSGIRAGYRSGAKVFFIPDAVPAKEADREFVYALMPSMKDAPAIFKELTRN